MTENEIYEKFTEWLKTSWFGVPDSPYSMTAIKARYTPEDAAFLTGIPYRSTPLAALAELKKLPETEIKEKLDEMARKGLVWRTETENGLSYYLNDLYFVIMRSSFWPGRTDETTVQVAKETNKYYYNGMYTDFNKMKVGGLRTVPIRATVEDGREIKPYEDVVSLLDRFDYFTVSDCPCRQRKKLDPEYKESKKPSEVCLHFDELGHYIVESGMGREITREETEEILKISAKAGLVHGVSNWEHKPDTIWNCDKDHCMWFEPFYKMDRKKSLDSSNFIVKATSETCKGCGLCSKRCPMEALTMKPYPGADLKLNRKAQVPKLTAEHCIGCGVCVVKCPTQSLILEPRPEISDPPKTALEWVKDYWQAREK